MMAPRIEDYGGGAGGPDNSVAIVRAVSAATLEGWRRLLFGRGTYLFPSPIPPFGIGLILDNPDLNSSDVNLQRIFPLTDPYEPFFSWNGAMGEFGGGIHRMQITTTQPGGCPLLLTGTDETHRAAFFKSRELWISAIGNARWGLGPVINGLAITDPENGGIRDVRFDDLYVLQCVYNGLEVWNGRNIWMVGGGVFNSAGIHVNGSPTAKSEDVNLICKCGTNMYVYNTSLLKMLGNLGNLFRDGSVDVLRVYGKIGALYGSPAQDERFYV